MFKLFLSSLSVLALTSLVAGCALQGPANHEELCSKLRSQMLLNQTDHNISAINTTNGQKQEITDQIKANNC